MVDYIGSTWITQDTSRGDQLIVNLNDICKVPFTMWCDLMEATSGGGDYGANSIWRWLNKKRAKI